MKKYSNSRPRWSIGLLIILTIMWTIVGCQKEESHEGFVICDYPEGLYPESPLDLDNDGKLELRFYTSGHTRYFYYVQGGESLGLWDCYLSKAGILTNVSDITAWERKISFPLDEASEQYVAVKKVVGNNTYYGWFLMRLDGTSRGQRIYQTAMCTIPNQPISVGQTRFDDPIPQPILNPDIVSTATQAEDFIGTYTLNVNGIVGTLVISPAGNAPNLVQLIGYASFYSSCDTIYNTTATFDPTTNCLIPESSNFTIYDSEGSPVTGCKVSYGPIFHQGDSITFETKFFHPSSQGNEWSEYYHNNALWASSALPSYAVDITDFLGTYDFTFRRTSGHSSYPKAHGTLVISPHPTSPDTVLFDATLSSEMYDTLFHTKATFDPQTRSLIVQPRMWYDGGRGESLDYGPIYRLADKALTFVTEWHMSGYHYGAAIYFYRNIAIPIQP